MLTWCKWPKVACINDRMARVVRPFFKGNLATAYIASLQWSPTGASSGLTSIIAELVAHLHVLSDGVPIGMHQTGDRLPQAGPSCADKPQAVAGTWGLCWGSTPLRSYFLSRHILGIKTLLKTFTIKQRALRY